MNQLTFSPEMGPNHARSGTGTNPQSSLPGGLQVVRVLLADDHPVVRWGMSSSIASNQHVQVIGEAINGAEAVRKAKELAPDVVLMDIDMPEMNGLTATEILHRENPAIKVLLLSMHPYTGHMSRILQSGARGFILKSTRLAEIIEAICKVAAGETCFSADLAQHALSNLARHGVAELQRRVLSRREREVLIGIAEGLSNKEIAQRLKVSARTVETHRGHIMRKLAIRTIAGLTRYAVSEGLVVLPQNSERPESQL